MSLDLRYPVVMERFLFCTGKCMRYTNQHSVIYPDTETNTCKTCGQKNTVHYDRSYAVVYKEVDAIELEGIQDDINRLAGEITLHGFSKNLGKKDRSFITHIHSQLLILRKRVERLKNRQ